MKHDLLHEELSGEIIGAAMAVLNELRPGLDEKLYENALVLELQARGRKVEQQRPFLVRYRGTLVGTLVPDLIVDDKIIVDTKVVEVFNDAHVAQMIGYLAITGHDLALLVNFKFVKLKWKRVVRSGLPDYEVDPDGFDAELRRHHTELETGAAQGIPADRVIREMRARYGSKRPHRKGGTT